MKPRTLVLATASLAGAIAVTAPAEIVERVIVKVNGDIVTQTEFETRQIAAVQAARVGPDRVEAFLRQNNARILQEAIDDLLVVQRAGEIGMRVPPAYLKEVIDNIKKENNITSEDDFQRQLRREGMTVEDLKRNIERQVLRKQVLSRELEGRITVSDADARADYEAHKADHTKLAAVHLQEILVKGEGARAEAAELVRRARAGEDFAALAREHSASPTRVSGGDLGTLTRGEMNPDVEKVAFALEPGAVSEPFASGDGYHVLRVVEKTEGSVVPFEQVKADIVKRLTQDRMAKEYERYVEDLRKNAMIDVRVREVPLQVTVPENASSLLEPPAEDKPAEAEPAKAAPAEEAGPAPEFSTTPQARPERMGPAPLPGEDKPRPARPSPSPSPTPPPR